MTIFLNDSNENKKYSCNHSSIFVILASLSFCVRHVFLSALPLMVKRLHVFIVVILLERFFLMCNKLKVRISSLLLMYIHVDWTENSGHQKAPIVKLQQTFFSECEKAITFSDECMNERKAGVSLHG